MPPSRGGRAGTPRRPPTAAPDGGPYARGVDPTRADLLADIDAWVQAARTLEDTLATNGAQVEKGRAMVAEGADLADALATMSTTDRFLRMKQALADFESARFTLRSALVKTALDEGMTGKQLVELLGVPPGLTAQVLDDMDDGDGLGDGADTGHGSPD